jgi:hypothetical protein
MIGVLDELTVRPGCLAALDAHIGEQLVPLFEARGVRLVQRWLTPAADLGEADAAVGLRQQLLLVWSIAGDGTGAGDDDVAAWWRIRRGAHDPEVGAAWRVVDELVEQRTRRFLRPLP